MTRIIGKFGPFIPCSTIKVWGKVVHFEEIDRFLYVWTECAEDRHPASYDEYDIIATGQDLKGRKWYATVVTKDRFVWHLVR